jgi:hypothetical protein
MMLDVKYIIGFTELGAVLALYGSKAVAAGVSAAVSSVLAFLTMPFKGVQMNSQKVGK